MFFLKYIWIFVASFILADNEIHDKIDYDMYLVLPYRDLISKGYLSNAYIAGNTNVRNDVSSNRYKTLTKRMNINSNANIQIPLELAKEMGLLKNLANGICKNPQSVSDPVLIKNLCGKADSKVNVNSDMNPQLPGMPVFSVGQQGPAANAQGNNTQDVLTLNLKGKDGKVGKDGPKGKPGDPGPRGPIGQPGEKGAKGDNCIAETLIKQTRCNSDKIDKIKARLDRIERECAKNASLLASITLSVVSSLTQARLAVGDMPSQIANIMPPKNSSIPSRRSHIKRPHHYNVLSSLKHGAFH